MVYGREHGRLMVEVALFSCLNSCGKRDGKWVNEGFDEGLDSGESFNILVGAGFYSLSDILFVFLGEAWVLAQMDC